MNEDCKKIYTDWRADKNYVRIKNIEEYAKIVMSLITCGWQLDGQVMLGQMGVVFEELNDDLIRGVLDEVTKEDRHRPTDVGDISLS